MTRRERRVLNAFLNCIESGDYTLDYAITLIEDNERYGWITASAKDWFYEQLDKRFPEEPEEEGMELLPEDAEPLY